jgi:hypothetical protein
MSQGCLIFWQLQRKRVSGSFKAASLADEEVEHDATLITTTQLGRKASSSSSSSYSTSLVGKPSKKMAKKTSLTL